MDFATGFAIAVPGSAFIITVGQVYLANRKRNNGKNSESVPKPEVVRIWEGINNKISVPEHERLCASRLKGIHDEMELTRKVVSDGITKIESLLPCKEK